MMHTTCAQFEGKQATELSFGFSIGDFLAVVALVNKVRKDFVGAPAQFQQVSDELRNLEHTTRDIEVLLSGQDLSKPQEERLHELTENCDLILKDVQGTVSRYSTSKSRRSGIRDRATRLWNRLQWEPDDVRDLRGRITLAVTSCTFFLEMLNGENIVKLVKGQEQQEQREQERGQQEILDWLTPINYHDQQSDFIRRRQPGTGQWLLDSPEYQHWVATKGEALFCPGIPGAGKTMLTSIVVENLLGLYGADLSAGICYIFLNFRRTAEQKLNDIVASLVKQLAQTQPLSASIKTFFKGHKARNTRPSFDELCRALNSLVTEYSRVFIVIDALDECQMGDDDCRLKLISKLLNLQSKLRVSVLATSRFIPEITSKFDGAVVKEIRASEDDIMRYIDGKLSILPNFVSRDIGLQDEIKKSIVDCVDGMFLLAQLHLNSLQGKRSARAIRNTLSKLGKGSDAYDTAYDDAMNRITGQPADQKDLALETLMWITYVIRHLTTIELRHALGIELNETEFHEDNLSDLDDIVSNCCGLVTVDQETDIIRLVHYTTQEYFSRTGKSWFPDADFRIAQACVTYFSLDAFESGFCTNDTELELQFSSYPLFGYASQYWGIHAYSVPDYQFCYTFLSMTTKVHACSQRLFFEIERNNPVFPYLYAPKNITGLYLAAFFGLYGLVKRLVEVSEINKPGGLYGTPIQYAIINGHADVVELLLEKGVDIESRQMHCGTPFIDAVLGNNEAIVRLLLEKAIGNESEAMFRLLLEKGANIEPINDDPGYTPLTYAVHKGNEAIVQVILNNGADIGLKDRRGNTALRIALRKNNKTMAQLLRENGAVDEELA
ncbi:hypothetical protein F4823DRAFT_627840 [Ustulina deusta]|nr:hypothetical protein F4823DRAFT_627840 [Ustulina deusta]